MTPIDDYLKLTLESLKGSGDANNIAYAHNYLFEERVSEKRQSNYEADYPNSIKFEDWDDHHENYLEKKIKIASEIPETFKQVNSDAHLPLIEKKQRIVRMERLDGRLKSLYSNFAVFSEYFRKFRELSDNEQEDAEAWLEDFCYQWNTDYRDNRPSFVALYYELEKDIKSKDWPHRIRNRLGLSHYNLSQNNDSIPVALMLYSVEDVLKGLKHDEKTMAFSFPTVLDGDINEYFFPSPKTAEYGRTLNLEHGEKLVSEILHRRIDYKPEYFYKVGHITKPIPNHPLIELRNHHLFYLQVESDNENFGEEIPKNASE